MIKVFGAFYHGVPGCFVVGIAPMMSCGSVKKLYNADGAGLFSDRYFLMIFADNAGFVYEKWQCTGR